MGEGAGCKHSLPNACGQSMTINYVAFPSGEPARAGQGCRASPVRAGLRCQSFLPLFAALGCAPSARARCRPEGQRQRQPRLWAGGAQYLGLFTRLNTGTNGSLTLSLLVSRANLFYLSVLWWGEFTFALKNLRRLLRLCAWSLSQLQTKKNGGKACFRSPPSEEGSLPCDGCVWDCPGPTCVCANNQQE